MIVGAVCMSHSPLLDRNRAQSETEKRFDEAVKKAGNFVAGIEPTLAIVFYPDHINGFFYNLLPAFCVGIEGSAIGDYGTVAGKLDIPESVAMDCATFLLRSGIDVAISYRLTADHGAVQPLELLSATSGLTRMIPIFINCAAAPRASFARARALGQAVGQWAQKSGERVLIMGSGGLSHDPPVPALATATPDVRTRLIDGGTLSHGQRLMCQTRAQQEGINLAAGKSNLLPLNPEWDRSLLDAFSAGNLSVLDDIPEEEMTGIGGRGGHEVRTWVAALGAMGSDYRSEVVFYEAINEWITGMGIMTAKAA